MTPSRPLSQRVMGFNWTQLSASKAHNHETGRLGSWDPGGAPSPEREAEVVHWGWVGGRESLIVAQAGGH